MGVPRAVWVYLLALAGAGASIFVLFDADDDGDGRNGDEDAVIEAPTTADHWHTAYGIYVCNRFLDSRDNGRDPLGIHTHGDGLVHVHPFSSEATGKKATVGLFFESHAFRLDDRTVRWEEGEWVEGTATCDGRPGQVVVATPEGRVTDDVGSVRLRDCSWVTIAFVPEGADVPKPTSIANLAEVSDLRDPGACPGAAA